MIKDLLALSDTVELMQSTDYRDRFVAEYIQTALRYERLKNFNTAIEAAEQWMYSDDMIDHDCPLELLQKQQKAMGEYLHVLELRAKIEDIDLADVIAALVANKQTCCRTKRCPCEENTLGDTELRTPDPAACVGADEPQLEGHPVLECCPVRIGDMVFAACEDEEHRVDLIRWEVKGIGYFNGKYYAVAAEGDINEVGTRMCIPAYDAEEARRKYLETYI